MSGGCRKGRWLDKNLFDREWVLEVKKEKRIDLVTWDFNKKRRNRENRKCCTGGLFNMVVGWDEPRVIWKEEELMRGRKPFLA